MIYLIESLRKWVLCLCAPGIIIITVSIFVIPLAQAAITFDAQSTAVSSSNPITFTHTNNGDFLILGLAVRESEFEHAGGPPTYNGVAMIQAGSGEINLAGNLVAELWYLVNPATGANTVSIPNDDLRTIRAIVSSWSGIDQSTPLDDESGAQAGGGSPFGGSATTAASALVIDMLAHEGSGVSTIEQGTDLYVQDEGPWNSGAHYIITGGATTQNMTYTTLTSSDWAQKIVAFKEGAAGPDGTPPTTTATPSGGTYSGTQSVTLSVNEPATTYYTTDGSLPTTSSPIYTSAISIATTTTVQFFSVDTAGNTESIKSAAYTILPPDTTAPTVSLTAPSNGATVSGSVTVAADASDAVGVTGVTFRYNGIAIGSEDTTSPYSVSWNTASVANGTYTLTAVARDAAGNTTTSSGITVTVSNAAPPPSGAGDPVILYTDIESGPNTGGEGNLGAYLSIYGKNFGTSRASGDKVTIGGTEVASYLQWGAPSRVYDSHGIQVISVRIGSAITGTNQPIVVTAGGKTSNSNHTFSVRPGTMYYVKPNGNNGNDGLSLATAVAQPNGCENKMSAGDHCIIMGGTYGAYNDSYAIYLDDVLGTASDWIWFIGMPGQNPLFDDGGGMQIRMVYNNYVGLANMEINGNGSSQITWRDPMAGASSKIVNMDTYGMRGNGGGTGAYAVKGNGVRIYGNKIYNQGCNKLYHNIYVSVGENFDIGWNHIYDNRDWCGTEAGEAGGRGIQVFDGPPSGGFSESQYIDQLYIHDNIIHDIAREGIAFGAVTRSGEIYNNIVYRTGTVVGSGIRFNDYVGQCNGYFVYNNVFYDNDIANYGGVGHFEVEGGSGDPSIPNCYYAKNNIFYSTHSENYYYFSRNQLLSDLIRSNNLFYGAGGVPTGDTNSINADPLLVDPTSPTRNFRPQSSSPAIDAGTALALVARDLDGTSRPQGLAYDIGAYEFVDSGGGGGDTTAPTVSLTAPSNGATVSGTVTVAASASDNVGVVGVTFRRNGITIGSEDTTSPYSVSWNTTGVTNNTYTLTAVARDAAGNTTTSASRSVTVSNSAATTTTNVSISVSLERESNVDSQNVTLEIYAVGGTTILHSETKTPSSGDLVFSSLPLAPGSYDVRLNAPYYLSQKETMTLSDSADLTFPTLPAGDVNNDNVINSSDWTFMSGRWFTSDPVADINRDSLVNSLDFSVMNRNWFDEGE